MQANTFRKSLALVRTPRFGIFWFASLLANIGTWAQQVAQPWLLLSLGASSFLIGLDAFALSAPLWLLVLVGGTLADRADRRWVITVFQSIQMLCPVILVVLLLTGTVEPWVIITLSLITGITDALSMPSFQTIVPSIVTHDQIATGLALNSTQFNLSRVIGPALAGFLLITVGAVGCFAVSAASYLPFILVALWILPRKEMLAAARQVRAVHSAERIGSILREPYQGCALLTILATSALCGPLVIFCPLLVRDALHGDVGNFSIAVGSFGAGGLLGAIALLFVDPEYDRRRLICWSAGVFGLSVVLVSVNPWMWGLPPLLILAGLAMSISSTSANSLLQTSGPTDLRGLTVSLFMLAMRGGISLGGLAMGVSVNLLGIRHALLLNGVATIIIIPLIAVNWLAVARTR